MKLLCCALFGLLAACVVDGKSPCCIPDQWEAMAGGETDMVQQGRPIVISIAQPKLSVDLKAKKIAVQELVYSSPVGYNLSVIMDYNVGSMWVIHWGPGPRKCVKQPLPTKTPQKCIPANFTYGGTMNMGFGSNVVSVDNFVSPPPYSSIVSVLVTSDTCAPVTEFMRKGGDTPTVGSMGYFNVTAGIKDPSVFNVPAFCQKASLDWNLENDLRGRDMPKLSSTSQYLIQRFTKPF